MGDFDASSLGAAAAIALGILLILWFGFRILFLPLRLSWRFGRAIAQKIGPTSMTLVVVWTIAIVPEPFVYLWSWFLRLGKALLVDVPRQATQILTETPTACGSDAIGACAAAIGTEVLQLWSSAMSQPLQAFLVPQNIERAALVFALGLTVAFVLTLIPSPQSQKATRGDARTIAALVVSFLLAFYLAIISIIAIPVFGEKVPVLGPYRANLADQLKQETPTDDIKFPMLVQMDDERHTLPDISMLGLPPQLDYIGSAWKDQIFLWDQEAQRLHQSAASFPGEAREFAQTTLSFFQVSNEGHIGEIATQRHVTVLANSFNLWIADYHALLDACAATLRDGLGRARAFYETVLPVGKSMTAQANVTPEQSNQTYQQLNQALQSFYFQRCTDLKPVAREYLTMRSGPVETLGPFGAAAAWLLRTESPELALIIGLLGFGFFGALAASFIREFAGTPRNELPAIGFILPALIRGVGAAILVFLLAKGGTAILTTGDASPNAYAIFFACFVAAVFSEDVWSWARSRQRRQFAEEKAEAEPSENLPAEPKRD